MNRTRCVSLACSSDNEIASLVVNPRTPPPTPHNTSLCYHSGSRVIEAPRGSGGLFAVLGPDRSVQIRSWRMAIGGAGSGRSMTAGNAGGTASSAGGHDSSVGSNPIMVEKELARIRCGDYEKVRALFGQ